MIRSKPRPSGARRAGTVRIIGGAWKRRSLVVPDVEGLRPTPDRVRETLFNWLTHAYGDLNGLAVLDLFAGSGALGFEAASRGAAGVTLVEADPDAARLLRAACVTLGGTQIQVLEEDAVKTARTLLAARRTFDVIFLDPPFGQRWLDTVLPLASDLCAGDGFIYVETETALSPTTIPAGCELYRADKAGEVFYHLLRRNKKE